MKDFKYIFLTLFLSAILVIPFVLKLKNPRLEIYPAVIMPSGASLFHNGDTIKYYSRELYGLKRNEWQRIPVKQFLGNIPEWYLYEVAKSEFGMKPVSEKFKLYKPPYKFNKHNRYTKKNLEHAKSFFKDQLRSLNFNDSIFAYKIYLNAVHNDKVKKTLQSESIYMVK